MVRNVLAVAAPVLLAMFAAKAAFPAQQTLMCELRDIEIKNKGAKFESKVDAEKRSIAVIFDDEAKTLVMKQEGAETPLRNIAISQTSMTGAAGNTSLGIDRSSWRIVFQTYALDSTQAEFGECRLQP